MNARYPDPERLWNMSPDNFNEWRAQNDLPKLFEYLRHLLPGFGDWLNTLPFDMNVVVRIVPTGEVFKGTRNKVVFRRTTGVPNSTVIECREGDLNSVREWWRQRSSEVEVLGEIEPYFKWAKRTLGRQRFFIWDTANQQVTDKFLYGGWSGLNVEGCVTQANLFRDFVVLKLGQITLKRAVIIGSRNLDFCDLDYLTIEEDFHGSYWTTISYSSVREITFINTEIAFYTFHKCTLGKFIAKRARLQDFYFEEIDIQELRLSDCFIYRLEFIGSSVTPLIQNCELREFKFSPRKSDAPSSIANTYRLLRAAFQSSGLRKEASDCYYFERVFERKSYFHPFYTDLKTFQGILHGGRLTTVLDLYRSGLCKSGDLPRELYKTFISKLRMHLLPKYFIPLLKFRLRWFASGFGSVIWGYGERPSRIVLMALELIGSYGIAYSLLKWPDDKGVAKSLSLWDSVYFSVVTFTTLGYGDITPKTVLLKCLAGSEALLGAFTIGLIVAGFSNRSRY